MNDLKTRFIQLADYYDMSVRKLEDELDLMRGNISNIKGAIGSDKLSKIHDKHPEINLVWLVTGKGNMISDNKVIDSSKINSDQIITILIDRIEQLAIEVASLKSKLNSLNEKDVIPEDVPKKERKSTEKNKIYIEK